MMHYKGYIGKIEFDEDADLFHGEVVNTRDVITFQGRSVDELKQAFHESVDDYLDFCAERGEAPDKPFSGRFVVRVDPEIHREAATAAKLEGRSLNRWAAKVLAEASAATARAENVAKHPETDHCRSNRKTASTKATNKAANKKVSVHRRKTGHSA